VLRNIWFCSKYISCTHEASRTTWGARGPLVQNRYSKPTFWTVQWELNTGKISHALYANSEDHGFESQRLKITPKSLLNSSYHSRKMAQRDYDHQRLIIKPKIILNSSYHSRTMAQRDYDHQRLIITPKILLNSSDHSRTVPHFFTHASGSRFLFILSHYI
jgi:hypothetical protein